MRTSITTETLRRLPLQNLDIRDLRLPGFVVRCRTSGKHSFRVQLGRGRWITIGRVGVLSLDEARQQARIALGEQAKGGDPIEARRRKRGHTLRSFLAEVYGRDRGQIDLSEAFVDATFASAKKGACHWSDAPWQGHQGHGDRRPSWSSCRRARGQRFAIVATISGSHARGCRAAAATVRRTSV